MYVTILKIDIPSLTDLDSHILISLKGPGLSLVGCMYDWYFRGRGFDPPVRQHSFLKICHENISTSIISIPLIQVGQLSVTGEGCAHNSG